MSHKQLWAPWRLAYVTSTPQPGEVRPACFLCHNRDADRRLDREHLVLWRSRHAIVVLNRFPYNNGHLLIAPLAHKADPRELSDEETLDCQRLISGLLTRLEAVIHPDGFNLGLNLGRVAGAGLPGHLHWHIVPRWNGDTNFMPVLGDARIIPQSLDALVTLLGEELQRQPL